MKIYLNIFILLLAFSSVCIAQNNCTNDGDCLYGTCESGDCVCDGNWSGPNCNTCEITCSNDDAMYLDESICECISIESQAIPTISQWGLIVLGLILSLFGIVAVKRKKLKLA